VKRRESSPGSVPKMLLTAAAMMARAPSDATEAASQDPRVCSSRARASGASQGASRGISVEARSSSKMASMPSAAAAGSEVGTRPA